MNLIRIHIEEANFFYQFKMKEMNCQVKVENKYQDNIDADKGWIDVFKYLDTLHVPHKNMKA